MLRALNWLEVEIESKNKEKEPIASSRDKQTSSPKSEGFVKEAQVPPEKKKRAVRKKAALRKNSNQEDEKPNRTRKKRAVSEKSRNYKRVQMRKFVGTSLKELETNS